MLMLQRIQGKNASAGSQNSVRISGKEFRIPYLSVLVDPTQFTELKHRLESIIDPEKDSLRYYFLGSN
jgi:hypothetical protein